MAKTPKLKHKPSGANPRSRAARRRATSPSTNTPKSLTKLSRAPDCTPLLDVQRRNQAAVVNGGITKKRQQSKNKNKKQTRQQRLRQERGLARAEDVLDKMERKVEGSLRKVKVGRERRRGWDEVNEGGIGDRGRLRKGEREGEGGAGKADQMDVDDEWEDDISDGKGAVEAVHEHKQSDGLGAESRIVGPDAEILVEPENEEDNIT